VPEHNPVKTYGARAEDTLNVEMRYQFYTPFKNAGISFAGGWVDLRTFVDVVINTRETSLPGQDSRPLIYQYLVTLNFVRFQVLEAAGTKMTAFWNMTQCSLVEADRRFAGEYCLDHHGDIGLFLRDYTAPHPRKGCYFTVMFILLQEEMRRTIVILK
jgi:hypothetical protein